MKCPMDGSTEFSEWDNVCQHCDNFENCLDKFYNLHKNEKNKSKQSNFGDNFPDYGIIHLRLLLNKERTQMIEKLLIEELGIITQDDITDLEIDIELYNVQCRKQKIKERYKKRKKE